MIPHSSSIEEVLRQTEVGQEQGLSTTEASRRLEE